MRREVAPLSRCLVSRWKAGRSRLAGRSFFRAGGQSSSRVLADRRRYSLPARRREILLINEVFYLLKPARRVLSCAGQLRRGCIYHCVLSSEVSQEMILLLNVKEEDVCINVFLYVLKFTSIVKFYGGT